MINWTSSRSDASLTEQDDNPFGYVWRQFTNIKQLLETENLREFTGETIQYLAEQLREIIVGVRDLSDNRYAISREKVLKHLRDSAIELYLALDLLETKGRTLGFYKCLLNFQENFEKAFETRLQEVKDWKAVAANLAFMPAKQHSTNFFTQLWKHREELIALEESVQSISQAFSPENVQLIECKQAMSVLCWVNEVLEGKCKSLKSSLFAMQTASTTTLADYQLMVALCYAHEQAQKLDSLVTAFPSIYRPKSKRTLKALSEIARRLDLFTQTCDDIVQKMQLMTFSRDQIRFQRQDADND